MGSEDAIKHLIDACNMVAELSQVMYTAFINAKFSEAQAMELTKEVLREILPIGK